MASQNQNQFVTFTPYDEQMAELQRRQKMAELMQQQAIQPLETPQSGGRMIAKVSPVAGLAKMLQSYMAGSELRNVEKQRGAAEEAGRKEATDWLDSLQRGKPMTSDQALEASMSQAPTTFTPQQYTPQERATQIQKAAFSGNPNMRMAAQLAASQKTPDVMDYVDKIDWSKTTPESKQAFMQTVTQGRPDISVIQYRDSAEKPTVAGGMSYNPATGKWEEIPGWADQQARLRKAGAPSTTVTVDTGAGKELVGHFATELGKRHEKAAAAQGILDQVGRLENLTESGTFTGALAPKATGAAQFLQSFGINVNPKVLANSRAFEASANNLVLDFMGANGGARGFTEKETAILMNAFPQLVDSPEARIKIAAVLRDKANREISGYNTQLGQFKNAYPTAVVPYEPIESEDDAYQRYLKLRKGK